MSVYRGDRTIDGTVVMRDGHPLADAVNQERFSDIGLDWGFNGPAARQLAFAVLVDHLGDVPAARTLVEPFARHVVAQLDNEWELTSDNLAVIIATLRAR